MALAVADCHDRANHPPSPGLCHFQRIDCVDHPFAGFSVCLDCARETYNQLFPLPAPPNGRFTRMISLAVPQQPRTGPPNAANQQQFDGFKTYLCTTCEDREKVIREQRFLGAQTAAYNLTPDQQRFGMDLGTTPGQPDVDNTCTCLKRCISYVADNNLNPYRHCYWCRLQTFDDLANTAAENGRWLEQTERTQTWETARSSVAVRRQRDQNHTWRACRCGNTIRLRPAPVGGGVMAAHHHPALGRVHMCLACEGVIHEQPPAMVPRPPIVRHPRLSRHQRSVALGRPRSQYTAKTHDAGRHDDG